MKMKAVLFFFFLLILTTQPYPINSFRVLKPLSSDHLRSYEIFCEKEKIQRFAQTRSQFQRNFALNLPAKLSKLFFPTIISAIFSSSWVTAHELPDLEVVSPSPTRSEPISTDICWMDIQKERENEINRIEIALFGLIVPRTVQNFKELCLRKEYIGSEVFRVIPSFSVQIGNIGAPANSPVSQRSFFGRSALNEGKGLKIENFLVKHDHPSSGIVSMMKDKKGLQDSRFFITLSPSASWADDNYSAFGRVTRGMDFIRSLQEEDTKKPSNHPVKNIRIIDCGCYSK